MNRVPLPPNTVWNEPDGQREILASTADSTGIAYCVLVRPANQWPRIEVLRNIDPAHVDRCNANWHRQIIRQSYNRYGETV